MKAHFNLNFDNASCQKAATVIYSILENNPNHFEPRFHILHFDISRFNQLRLRLLARKANKNAEINFFRIDKSTCYFPVEENSPITAEAYLRLLACAHLPADAKRLLYLDIDTLVIADITQLFQIDMGDKIIAACNGWAEAGRKSMLGLPEDAGYFNSGVMLINVRAWREADITAKALQYIKDMGKPLPRWDQDALNHVLHDRWLKLPGIYNTRLCGNLSISDELYEHVDNILTGGG